MNKLEAAYAAKLEEECRAGTVAWYGYEVAKWRLADKTFYTPDFLVMRADGALECHEVKGFWEDDARVKIKVAAATIPVAFFGVQRIKGAWHVEAF